MAGSVTLASTDATRAGAEKMRKETILELAEARFGDSRVRIGIDRSRALPGFRFLGRQGIDELNFIADEIFFGEGAGYGVDHSQ